MLTEPFLTLSALFDYFMFINYHNIKDDYHPEFRKHGIPKVGIPKESGHIRNSDFRDSGGLQHGIPKIEFPLLFG